MRFRKFLEDGDLNAGMWTPKLNYDRGLHRRQTLKPPKEVKYKNDNIDKKFVKDPKKEKEDGVAPDRKKR